MVSEKVGLRDGGVNSPISGEALKILWTRKINFKYRTERVIRGTEGNWDLFIHIQYCVWYNVILGNVKDTLVVQNGANNTPTTYESGIDLTCH